ncbi:MAG: hypothetical protein JNG84_00260 [Archangium sp.]|nr:hypothetical protein [Archangium sp.]
MRSIARTPGAFRQVREVRADQYGLRTLVEVGGTVIKVEVVLEARITLAVLAPPTWCVEFRR